jgi:hypothetical protein
MGLLAEDVGEYSACQRPNPFPKKCQRPNPRESGRGERLSQAGPLFRRVESARPVSGQDVGCLLDRSGLAGLFPYFVHLMIYYTALFTDFLYIYKKKLCSVVYCVYAEDDPASIVGRTDHTVTVLSELRGNSSHELICSTSCKLGSATI